MTPSPPIPSTATGQNRMNTQRQHRLYEVLAQWLEKEDQLDPDHEHHHARLADDMTNAAAAVYDAGQNAAREANQP